MQSAFQFIQKLLARVEVRGLCRPLKFFHINRHKPHFEHRLIVMLEHVGASQLPLVV